MNALGSIDVDAKYIRVTCLMLIMGDEVVVVWDAFLRSAITRGSHPTLSFVSSSSSHQENLVGTSMNMSPSDRTFSHLAHQSPFIHAEHVPNTLGPSLTNPINNINGI